MLLASRAAFVLGCLLATAAPAQQGNEPPRRGWRTQGAADPLGPGPQWRGPVHPTAANEVFATGNGCAMCHSGSANAFAMRTPTGEDVSPHALWEATLMANSFRDPYWRAQMAKESALAGERAGDVQALCFRCHAPMAHHTARLGGQPPPSLAQAAKDPLAQDGVSCTVCHQIRADGLGDPKTWSGRPAIERGRRIFGPYEDPRGQPMTQHAAFTPEHAPHVQQSALCATCHTLHAGHAFHRALPGKGDAAGSDANGAGTQTPFPEQTPYLEWRNSDFTTETPGAASPKSCQQCHMADLGTMRIARNPAGRDFLIPARSPYRSHAIVGGNAFVLDLLAANAAELGVTAPPEALRKTALAARRLLADETVAVTIGELEREDGALSFSVRVANRTGHKFPSGYPSRRAWLRLQVRAGRDLLFETGRAGAGGRIEHVADDLAIPHRTAVEAPEDVVVWELVAADPHGAPTTALTKMASRKKDNRLLPKGWSRSGPHAGETAPVGTDSDLDFTAGGDTVAVRVPLPAGTRPVTVWAWVHFQTVPPHWVDALRDVDAEECRAFVRMYDAADKTPETAGLAVRTEGQ